MGEEDSAGTEGEMGTREGRAKREGGGGGEEAREGGGGGGVGAGRPTLKGAEGHPSLKGEGGEGHPSLKGWGGHPSLKGGEKAGEAASPQRRVSLLPKTATCY